MKQDKSRIFLANALLELMRDKPYSKISVKDITQRAYVSRATFYNHFKHPDEIIEFLLERAFERLPVQMPFSAETIPPLTEAVYGSIELFSLLRDQELLYLAPRFLEQIFICPDAPQETTIQSVFQIRSVFYAAFGICNRYPGLIASDAVTLIRSTRTTGITGNLCAANADSRIKPPERRTQATLAAMQDALNRCLEKMPLYQITVSRLTETANVSRSSFYRHYSDIDRLVHDMLRQAFQSVLFSSEPCPLDAALERYAPYRTLFCAAAVSGKDLEVMECHNLELSDLKPPFPDDIPWREILREQAARWCLTVNHVTAVLLYFESEKSFTPSAFSALLQATF